MPAIVVKKAPYEQFNVSLDFAEDIDSSSIASVSSFKASRNVNGAKFDTTAQVLSGAPVISGTAVEFTVIGGNVGEVHDVTVEIVSGTSELYQGDLVLQIVD